MTTNMMKTVITKQSTAKIHVFVPTYNHGIAALDCHVDIISVNGPSLGLRGEQTGLSWMEIGRLIEIANGRNTQVFLQLNTVIHNRDIPLLRDMLDHAKQIGIAGIVFSDTAVLYQAKELTLTSEIALFLSTETTVTNNEMLRFWHQQGVAGFRLSRELNLDQLADMVACKQEERYQSIVFEVQIHGPIDIFHTLRPVLRNFQQHLHTEDKGHDTCDRQSQARNGTCNQRAADKGDRICDQEFAFKEEIRPDDLYRVQEDDRGTYIFSSKDISLYPYLPQLLELDIDILKIVIHDRQSTADMKKIIDFYQQAMARILQHTFVAKSDWQQQLEAINQFPIENTFIELGAPK